MVFDLIVSALVTVLVVTLTDGILTFFGNGLMNIGYRSAGSDREASAHRCGR